MTKEETDRLRILKREYCKRMDLLDKKHRFFEQLSDLCHRFNVKIVADTPMRANKPDILFVFEKFRVVADGVYTGNNWELDEMDFFEEGLDTTELL